MFSTCKEKVYIRDFLDHRRLRKLRYPLKREQRQGLNPQNDSQHSDYAEAKHLITESFRVVTVVVFYRIMEYLNRSEVSRDEKQRGYCVQREMFQSIQINVIMSSHVCTALLSCHD